MALWILVCHSNNGREESQIAGLTPVFVFAGKVHKVFEEVSKLPRRQQEKIVEVVSALVSQYAQSRQ